MQFISLIIANYHVAHMQVHLEPGTYYFSCGAVVVFFFFFFFFCLDWFLAQSKQQTHTKFNHNLKQSVENVIDI